jgi:hypothetical protein
VEVLAMKRIEQTAEDLRRDARGVWKLVTITSEDLEGWHRNENYLREKRTHRNRGFLSNSRTVR